MTDHIEQTFDAKKGRLMFTNTKTGKKGWSMDEVMESSNTPEIAARSSKSAVAITKGYLEKFHLEREDEATAAAESTRIEARTDKERKIVEASLLVFVQGIEVFKITQHGTKRKQKRVLYIDQTEIDKGHTVTTLFCGKKKQDPKAKQLKLLDILEVRPTEGITIEHSEEKLQVMVDTERSRDHVVRMLNKLVDQDMWQRRYFEISPEQHTLTYHKSDPATTNWPQSPLQTHDMATIQSLTRGGPDQRLLFLRFPGQEEITLRAKDGAEAAGWYNGLQSSFQRSRQQATRTAKGSTGSVFGVDANVATATMAAGAATISAVAMTAATNGTATATGVAAASAAATVDGNSTHTTAVSSPTATLADDSGAALEKPEGVELALSLDEVGDIPSNLESLSLKAMKQHLSARGVDYGGFQEKREYREMLVAIQKCELADTLQQQADREAGRL